MSKVVPAEPLSGFPIRDWRIFFDAMPEAVSILDADSRIVWANRAMAEFVSLPPERLVGLPCREAVHGSNVPFADCPYAAMKAAGRAVSAEFEAPGRNRWLRVTLAPLFAADGRLAGAVHSIGDITERKRAERRIEFQARRDKLFNRIGTSLLHETDIDGVIRIAMRELCRMLGLPRCTARIFGEPGKVLDYGEQGAPSTRFVLPLFDPPPGAAEAGDAWRSRAVGDIRALPRYDEFTGKEAERVRLGAFLSVPMRTRGKPIGVLSLDAAGPHAWTDEEIATAEATARRLAISIRHAELFRRSDELAGRLLSLMNNVPGVVYRGLRDWSLTFIGTGVEALTGYPAAAFTGGAVSWRDRIHRDDLARVKQTFHDAVRAGKAVLDVEYRFVRRDGGVVWLTDRRQLIYDAKGDFSYVDGLLFDVTEPKATEERAREHAETLRSVIRASPMAIMAIDPDGYVTMWNAAAERIFGWTEDEAVGRFNPMVPEDKLDEHAAFRARVLSGESFTGVETRRRRKDGSMIDVSLSTAPLSDPDGAVVGIVAVLSDITGQKKTERALRDSGEQLRQAQKMEAIGRLAGGVAHDFNNLLTAIRGYGELLLLRLDDRPSLRKDLEELIRAGDRAASLTQQLLAFSRRQVLQPKVIDLNGAVSEIDKMLRRLIGEDILLSAELAPDLWRVRVDPGQIGQVVMNLAVNARDAMPKGGRIVIATSNVLVREGALPAHPYVVPGEYVALSVIDTGCGIDAETRERIFEPFFTTKELGKGTGLGLSTVYGIVKQSGGYVCVDSEPGKGSTFTVYLPRFSVGAEDTRIERAAGPAPGGAETVLLVEDEEIIRVMVRGVLGRYGYKVLEAADGEEALAVAKRAGVAIQLLITDVVMPRMGGRDLAESLARLAPGIKVLYMTGYTDDEIVHHGLRQGDTLLIKKPFTLDALLRKVREVLG